MRRIAELRFLGDLFFAIGIGAVLLMTAPVGVWTQAQPLGTFRIALVRQFLPGGMRLDGLAVVADLLTAVGQEFAQLFSLTQKLALTTPVWASSWYSCLRVRLKAAADGTR